MNFDEYQNAVSWCEGMAKSAPGLTFKLFDNQTKVELLNGPQMTEAELGVKKELEHRDLIVEMLTKAGKEPDEEKIKRIAFEIARVHVKEDPQYYEKLEKVGL